MRRRDVDRAVIMARQARGWAAVDPDGYGKAGKEGEAVLQAYLETGTVSLKAAARLRAAFDESKVKRDKGKFATKEGAGKEEGSSGGSPGLSEKAAAALESAKRNGTKAWTVHVKDGRKDYTFEGRFADTEAEAIETMEDVLAQSDSGFRSGAKVVGVEEIVDQSSPSDSGGGEDAGGGRKSVMETMRSLPAEYVSALDDALESVPDGERGGAISAIMEALVDDPNLASDWSPRKAVRLLWTEREGPSRDDAGTTELGPDGFKQNKRKF